MNVPQEQNGKPDHVRMMEYGQESQSDRTASSKSIAVGFSDKANLEASRLSKELTAVTTLILTFVASYLLRENQSPTYTFPQRICAIVLIIFLVMAVASGIFQIVRNYRFYLEIIRELMTLAQKGERSIESEFSTDHAPTRAMKVGSDTPTRIQLWMLMLASISFIGYLWLTMGIKPIPSDKSSYVCAVGPYSENEGQQLALIAARGKDAVEDRQHMLRIEWCIPP